MTALNGGLEVTLGQHSYRHYMSTLREKKEALAGVKQAIDKITGKWSGFFSWVGKADKADLRQLVEQEINVLGDISSVLDNMTTLYGGERERLLAYYDVLGKRLEEIEACKPAELIPIEQPKTVKALIQSIKTQTANGFQVLMGNRLQAVRRGVETYAQESRDLMDRCQHAYGLLLLTSDQVRYAYQHLQHTAPALVSLIELNEARKVVGKSVEEVKDITGKIYATVNAGYSQLMDMHRSRIPFLANDGKKIELLGA